MSYLQDKKTKRKKILRIIIPLIFLLFVFYARTNIWNSFSYLAHVVFRPILSIGTKIGGSITKIGPYFYSKNSLYQNNQELLLKLKKEEVRMANYDSLFTENEDLKKILGRKKENREIILATVLAGPRENVYDTLILDVGSNQNIEVGDNLFVLADIPIGKIVEVYPSTSKAILFSAADTKTEVFVSPRNTSVEESKETKKQIMLELVGRGGGNFEMILPRDLVLGENDQAILPGIDTRVVALVETVISDPRNPFIKVLFKSPVNVSEYKYVEIEKRE